MSGLALLLPATNALAAPTVNAAYSTSVVATTATLHAEVNPGGLSTAVRFEYLSEAAYQASLAGGQEGFAGATKAPPNGAGKPIGAGNAPVHTSVAISQLSPDTTYRYRVVATQGAEVIAGSPHALTTEPIAAIFALPEGRGWELVSPAEKNGGAVQGPGANFGGDLLQAAAQGGAATYSSSTSFGEDAQGAPAASQYLATRGSGGWANHNVTTPQRSAAEPLPGAGVPYRLFSADLATALMRGGGDCLTPSTGCADPSPPPAGSGAPEGYQDYYLRDSSSGAFQALVSAANAPFLTLSAEAFSLSLAGATPDLGHIVISTCAALTSDAIEVPQGEGCDPAAQNLYEWSAGGLRALNVLPGDTQTTPGAVLAAPAGAISTDGSRAYFSEAGALYLSEAGGQTKLLPESSGGGAAFQVASADGGTAYFTKGATLYRYSAELEASEPIATEVLGVLGASTDANRVYYETPAGLFLWQGGAASEVAVQANPENWPPATGTARLSADGTELIFSSTASLTGYDNLDAQTGAPDTELFLYDATAGQTTCVSCNPTNERPSGSASVPGALANGEGPLATQTYKPRALSSDGRRVFFDSDDGLALQDTNGRQDVYQWRAPGTGGCAKQGGCIGLLSSGRDSEASEFIDASADGTDAFFRTAASLLPTDPDSYDLYDARIGGGFPVAPSPIPCEADACQSLPPEPEDPAPGTLIRGEGNPPLRFEKAKTKKKKHKKHHHKNGHHKKHGGRK